MITNILPPFYGSQCIYSIKYQTVKILLQQYPEVFPTKIFGYLWLIHCLICFSNIQKFSRQRYLGTC